MDSAFRIRHGNISTIPRRRLGLFFFFFSWTHLAWCGSVREWDIFSSDYSVDLARMVLQGGYLRECQCRIAQVTSTIYCCQFLQSGLLPLMVQNYSFKLTCLNRSSNLEHFKMITVVHIQSNTLYCSYSWALVHCEFRSTLEAVCVVRKPVSQQKHLPYWPTEGALKLHMTLMFVILNHMHKLLLRLQRRLD